MTLFDIYLKIMTRAYAKLSKIKKLMIHMYNLCLITKLKNLPANSDYFNVKKISRPAIPTLLRLVYTKCENLVTSELLANFSTVIYFTNVMYIFQLVTRHYFGTSLCSSAKTKQRSQDICLVIGYTSYR